MKTIRLKTLMEKYLTAYFFMCFFGVFAGPGQSKMSAEESAPIITVINKVTLPNGNIIQARIIKKLNLSKIQELQAPAYGVQITPPKYDIVEFSPTSKTILRRYLLQYPVESIGINGNDQIKLSNGTILSISDLFGTKN